MSKVSKLLIDIRDTLNDPDGDRWNDLRLIRGINNAMSDINIKASILRSQLSFNILGGEHTYKLDDTVQTITRAVYNNISIDFKTHEEMDSLASTWEQDTADDRIDYIIYDKLNRGQIRLYPIPESDISGVSPDLGVTTDIVNTTFNSPFGVLTDIVDIKSSIVIYYIKKPTEVTTIDDDIILDNTWDKAIKYHVCGHALRDDKDTQNRSFGIEELQLYSAELMEARENSSKDFTEARQYESDYRRF